MLSPPPPACQLTVLMCEHLAEGALRLEIYRLGRGVHRSVAFAVVGALLGKGEAALQPLHVLHRALLSSNPLGSPQATSLEPKTPPSKRQSQSDYAENCRSHTKRCTCAAKSSSTLHLLTFPHVSSLFHMNLTRHASMFPSKTLSKSFAQCERHRATLRTLVATTTSREQDSTPRPPELYKREPFAMHSGKRRH